MYKGLIVVYERTCKGISKTHTRRDTGNIACILIKHTYLIPKI